MKKLILFSLLSVLFHAALSAQTYCLTANKVGQTASKLKVSFTLSSSSPTAINVDASFVVMGSGGISGTAIMGGFGNIGNGQSFSVFNPSQNPSGTYEFDVISNANAEFVVDASGELGVYKPEKIPLDAGCPINQLTVLPLELTSFTATKSKNNALLVWKTATEKDVSHFDVERSRDGVAFKTIGTVKAVGNSVDEQKYTLTDEATLSGINYYRLKAVDIDGKFKYSVVQSLLFSKPITAKAFPNPMKDELSVEIDVDRNAGEVFIELFDAVGKQVYQQKIQADKDNLNLTVPTSDLPVGAYLIRLKSASETWQQKITKI
jgi:hypothetical protein